ncbi:unnamed protein product [Schistocephalus solidus]|uniref:Uncharacterized protein n=1 Tax=Schistocephalus solidus TaxID=70667 RepID=A0A3P7D192_SCHSO|nr:unnamed protein product [Schistocephalus solidus]
MEDEAPSKSRSASRALGRPAALDSPLEAWRLRATDSRARACHVTTGDQVHTPSRSRSPFGQPWNKAHVRKLVHPAQAPLPLSLAPAEEIPQSWHFKVRLRSYTWGEFGNSDILPLQRSGGSTTRDNDSQVGNNITSDCDAFTVALCSVLILIQLKINPTRRGPED